MTLAYQSGADDQVAAGQVATDDFAPNQETAADQVVAVHETVADRDIAGNEVSANVQPEAIDLTGRELRLQENERDFLPLLASLLPTPRAVKKLTNLYRLLRIGVPKDQLAKFIGGDDGGPYQAVALLLAAAVGAPAQAESFLLALSSATANPGRDIADVLADFGEPPVANLLAERIRLIRKTLPVHGNVETYQESVQTVARYSFETYHGGLTPTRSHR
ncbi:MAG: hypothetical protein WBF75_07720 [Pseudonocardiaceae bacterium]